MNPKDRTVSALPLRELWNDQGLVTSQRDRWLGREDLRRLLQAGPVQFVIADAGLPLRWIDKEECYVFWKLDVRPHLVDQPERPFDIFRFPEGYAYVASEWMVDATASLPIVLLERHH